MLFVIQQPCSGRVVTHCASHPPADTPSDITLHASATIVPLPEQMQNDSTCWISTNQSAPITPPGHQSPAAVLAPFGLACNPTTGIGSEGCGAPHTRPSD